MPFSAQLFLSCRLVWKGNGSERASVSLKICASWITGFWLPRTYPDWLPLTQQYFNARMTWTDGWWDYLVGLARTSRSVLISPDKVTLCLLKSPGYSSMFSAQYLWLSHLPWKGKCKSFAKQSERLLDFTADWLGLTHQSLTLMWTRKNSTGVSETLVWGENLVHYFVTFSSCILQRITRNITTPHRGTIFPPPVPESYQCPFMLYWSAY